MGELFFPQHTMDAAAKEENPCMALLLYGTNEPRVYVYPLENIYCDSEDSASCSGMEG